MAKKRSAPKYESPEEEIAAAGAYRELREKLGAAFLEAQQEAYESWCAMDRELETPLEEVPLAAAHAEEEDRLRDLEYITLQWSYGGTTFEFNGYLGLLSSKKLILSFSEISGGDEQSVGFVVRFAIPEHQLFSEPLTIQFVKENLDRHIPLGTLPGPDILDLVALRQHLQVLAVEQSA
jgi:hypothetical protein